MLSFVCTLQMDSQQMPRPINDVKVNFLKQLNKNIKNNINLLIFLELS